MADGEILKHLLEVEHTAKELDQSAIREATRRIQEARAALDNPAKQAVAAITSRWEDELARHRQALAEEREHTLEAFQKSLEKRVEDPSALGRRAWTLLTGEP